MTKTFRLKGSNFYTGAIYSGIFLVIAILCAGAFWLDVPEKKRSETEPSVALVAGLGIATCAVMFLPCIYSVIAYKIERIVFDDDDVIIRSFFQNRRFRIVEIKQIKWRLIPAGGSVVIRGIYSKAKIGFYEYSHDDKLEIIRLMHILVPVDKQVNWPPFCHKIALPLRDGEPSILREDPSFKPVKVTRSRYDRFFLVMTLISAIHAVIWGLLLSSWEILALVPIVLLSWLVLRFTIPITGMIDTEPRSSNKMRAGMICLAVFCLSPFALVPIVWNVDGRIALGLFAFLSYGGMFGMMFFWGQRKAWSKKVIQDVHQRALAEWDEGERLLNCLPPIPC